MGCRQTTFRSFALFSSIMNNLLQNPDYGLPTFEAFSLSKIGDPANYFELHDTSYTPSPITPVHQNPPWQARTKIKFWESKQIKNPLLRETK